MTVDPSVVIVPSQRYISLPIETEPAAVQEAMYDYIRDRVPGWGPADGNLDVWIMQALSMIVTDLRAFASDVPDVIFRYFGESIVGLPSKAATYASFVATWTALDSFGHTIPAGTVVGVRRPDGEFAGFEVAMETTIPAGDTTVDDVPHMALEPGAASSGLSLATPNIELIDSLDWVQGIEGTGYTSGGADGETDEEYMDRLVQEFRILAPRPIIPNDFATMAKHLEGVDLVWTYNLYDLPTGTFPHDKCITIVVANENGDPVDATTLANVDAYLQANREVNFLVYVTNPKYQTVNVTYAVTSYPQRDQASVQQEIFEALNLYIGPKAWGAVRYSSEGATDPPVTLRVQNVVRYNDVIAAIDNVSSVDFVTALTLNGTTANVPLVPGAAGESPVVLPRLGTCTGTVTVPAT